MKAQQRTAKICLIVLVIGFTLLIITNIIPMSISLISVNLKGSAIQGVIIGVITSALVSFITSKTLSLCERDRLVDRTIYNMKFLQITLHGIIQKDLQGETSEKIQNEYLIGLFEDTIKYYEKIRIGFDLIELQDKNNIDGLNTLSKFLDQINLWARESKRSIKVVPEFQIDNKKVENYLTEFNTQFEFFVISFVSKKERHAYIEKIIKKGPQ